MTNAARPAVARRVAESAARASYGRLVALLAARSGDIAGAEDALAEAFTAALETWPDRGIPESPEAWLLTAARNAIGKRTRHGKVVARAAPDVLLGELMRGEARDPLDLEEGWSSVDHRLKLLFVCAHPAIDAAVRTPLMLQTVLGLDAERIGSAFLVAPATMGQRLVRAKTKIKAAGVRFAVPDARELPARLDEVLDAVYAAYGTGWDDLEGSGGRGLTEEALFLGRLLASLLPGEPEALGLLALMLFCESRREARRDTGGCFVPLDQQDPARWSRAMIAQAEELLVTASTVARFGRFQCEAAIQSVHAHRAITGGLDRDALRLLYDLLSTFAPSVGVAVARAASRLALGDVDVARAAIAGIDEADVARYQPYWVTRARVAEASGDLADARASLERGLGLTEDEAVRAFLFTQLSRLSAKPST